jgi:DNA-binding transcriptional MerR regulator
LTNGTNQADSRITINDLAERTGMTVRNIRAHQSRGLLDPPTVVGRTGYYDQGHVDRIELIRELQEEGFNLEAIRRIVASAGEDPGELLRFTRDVRAPYEDEQPEVMSLPEIAGVWANEEFDEERLRRCEELGLMRPLGDGRFEVLSPKLLKAGHELAAIGVPIDECLNTLETLKERSTAVAEIFIRLFDEQVWLPFDEAGRPRDKWPEVRDSLRRLRPLASDAFIASFQFAMEEVSEKAISEGIRRDLGDPEDAPEQSHTT